MASWPENWRGRPALVTHNFVRYGQISAVYGYTISYGTRFFYLS